MAKKEKVETLVPVEEQPHHIPNNWQWVRLRTICTDFIVPQRDKPKVFSGSIPWCRIEDIEGKYLNGTKSDQYVSDETIKEMNLRVCPVGTVICSCSASLGVQAILTVQCCTNQTFIGLVCSDLIRNEYLYFYLRSLEEYWQQIGTGTTIKYISRNKFEMLNTPLPPLPEQHRIVDRIESLFAKLDEAKEKAQAVVDGFEDRKAAILHKAFTGELTAEWRKKNCVTKKEWNTCTIGEAFELQAGKNISASQINASKTEEYTYPCYGGNGIRGYVKSYNREGEHPIIGRQGALCGNVNLAMQQFYATEHAVVVSYKMPMATTWALYYLRFLNLNQYATATAQPGLAVSKLIEIPITVPSHKEQIEISRILDLALQHEQQAKDAAEQVISQIDTMKKAILARAFRGELGTNDPSEPPAEIGIS